MNNIDALLQIFEKTYPMLQSLDIDQFSSIIPFFIDQWASDHGMSSKDTCSMLENMMTSQKMVHSFMGMPLQEN